MYYLTRESSKLIWYPVLLTVVPGVFFYNVIILFLKEPINNYSKNIIALDWILFLTFMMFALQNKEAVTVISFQNVKDGGR